MIPRLEKADYLFLDCEWADVFGHELVSIAIVSIDGLRHIYGELDILPTDPTPCVSAVVYPLLERGGSAMQIGVMAARLRNFPLGFDAPLICYDFSTDRDLCERVLARTSSKVEDGGLGHVHWQLIGDAQLALKA